MSALPSLPPSSPTPAPQSSTAASDAQGAARAARADGGDDKRIAQNGDDQPASFEEALEAQLNSLNGPKSVAPSADGPLQAAAEGKAKGEAEQTAGADAGTATALYIPQVIASVAHAALSDATGNRAGFAASKRGELKADIDGALDAPRAQATDLGSALSAEARLQDVGPAILAADLQGLPGAKAKHVELAASAPAPLVQPSAAPATNEHKTEAATAASVAGSSIAGRVGEAGWSNALSQRVVWMAGQNVQAAEFRVEPPQLGPIEVRLSITNDQASLTFAAAHPATREAIQNSLPRLQEMLMESGVTLGNVFVGAQNFQNQQQGGRDSAQSSARNSAEGNFNVAAMGAGALSSSRSGLGLVDLYA